VTKCFTVNVTLDAQIALGPIEPAIACFPSKLRFSHQSADHFGRAYEDDARV
jgi:hypothetical protein